MELYLDKKPNYKAPAEVQAFVQSRMGEALLSSELREIKTGKAGIPTVHLWLTVAREGFLKLVDTLGELDFPHFHVCSGNDDGDTIRQNYHFSLYRCEGRGKELNVTIVVSVPKSDPVLPSLHSRIPGVGFAEREMFEMLGVDHDGQPVKDLVFLPDDWDRSILPWRRDEKGPEGKGVINELS